MNLFVKPRTARRVARKRNFIYYILCKHPLKAGENYTVHVFLINSLVRQRAMLEFQQWGAMENICLQLLGFLEGCYLSSPLKRTAQALGDLIKWMTSHLTPYLSNSFQLHNLCLQCISFNKNVSEKRCVVTTDIAGLVVTSLKELLVLQEPLKSVNVIHMLNQIEIEPRNA